MSAVAIHDLTPGALYLTIWIAVGLFVIGERPGAWRWSLAGLVIAIVHVAIALAAVHGWSQRAAMAATARQTEAVYGLRWGGGVFVNYAFLAVWAVRLARRMRRPAPDRWPPANAGRWDAVLRVFLFVVIVNASVVFAAGWRRGLGVAACAALLWIWRRPSRIAARP